ncbi:MAG: A24 family peptidase, partial [Candidatus Woesearchaeota archaeon]|nr:A24 family peptidase [Candidatus Woesearchaeota archaeon]
MPELFLLIIALIILAIGSFTDFRSREVPDWLSYSGIVLGFLIHIVLSVISFDYHPVLYSVIGFGIFWLVGATMYYAGQWGGGDAKILMALGAIMGVQMSFSGAWQSWYSVLWSDFMIGFLINSLLIGAVYGVVWLAVLSLKNYAKLNSALRVIIARERLLHWTSLWSFVICIALALFLPVELQPVMLLIAVWCLVFFCLFVWLKSVEESCMKVFLPVA